MVKLVWLCGLLFLLSGCGDMTGPCDDSDPVGICATSHSQDCVC